MVTSRDPSSSLSEMSIPTELGLLDPDSVAPTRPRPPDFDPSIQRSSPMIIGFTPINGHWNILSKSAPTTISQLTLRYQPNLNTKDMKEGSNSGATGQIEERSSESVERFKGSGVRVPKTLSPDSLELWKRSVETVTNLWNLDLSDASPTSRLFAQKGQPVCLKSAEVLAALAYRYPGRGLDVVAGLQKYSKEKQELDTRKSPVSVGLSILQAAKEAFKLQELKFARGNFGDQNGDVEVSGGQGLREIAGKELRKEAGEEVEAEERLGEESDEDLGEELEEEVEEKLEEKSGEEAEEETGESGGEEEAEEVEKEGDAIREADDKGKVVKDEESESGSIASTAYEGQQDVRAKVIEVIEIPDTEDEADPDELPMRKKRKISAQREWIELSP